MGLLEESGIILGNEEAVLKQGRCKGRVPKGIEMKTSTLGVYLLPVKRDGSCHVIAPNDTLRFLEEMAN